jgi:hypothetical protein
MSTENSERIKFAENEITSYVKKFSKTVDDNEAGQIAKKIVNLIDWNNSALMHKGLSWITKNYLMNQE